MLSNFAAWRRRRETVRELTRLSDRQLADIGLNRAGIADAARIAPGMANEAVAPHTRSARLGSDPIFDESFDASALPSRA